jgi:2-C-methyl-D-erythritol 4-phosphate cytidylyltransferase
VERYAVIVAGGKGERMNSDLPKQFITIGEQPILMHTITAFNDYDPSVKIILVLPKIQIALWKFFIQL